MEHKNVLARRSILPTIFRVDLNNDATRSCNNKDQDIDNIMWQRSFYETQTPRLNEQLCTTLTTKHYVI